MALQVRKNGSSRRGQDIPACSAFSGVGQGADLGVREDIWAEGRDTGKCWVFVETLLCSLSSHPTLQQGR